MRVHVAITNATAGTVQLQASNSGGSGTVTINEKIEAVQELAIDEPEPDETEEAEPLL